MIDENRKNHIFAVAELMKKYGQEHGFSEQECVNLFTLGFLHDVGYEFLEEKEFHLHARVGGEFMKKQKYKFWREIFWHGKANCPYQSKFLDILNWADMHINFQGNFVSYEERLKDISLRYGIEIESLESKTLISELKEKGFE